jgi:hypothetical protein
MTNYIWADTCETMEDKYYTFKNIIINDISNLLDEDMDYLAENDKLAQYCEGEYYMKF